MAITARVLTRVTEDRVRVSIPGYDFPHSIIDHTKVNRGQQIDLKGEVTRIEENTVTIDLGPLVTGDRDKVRLVEKYRPPNRRKALVVAPD